MKQGDYQVQYWWDGNMRGGQVVIADVRVYKGINDNVNIYDKIEIIDMDNAIICMGLGRWMVVGDVHADIRVVYKTMDKTCIAIKEGICIVTVLYIQFSFLLLQK